MIISTLGVNVILWGKNIKEEKAKDESSRIPSLKVCTEDDKPKKTVKGGGRRMK